nr:MAG TPA: Baseplate wedge protein [Herelleviridae sp.]
MGNFFKNLHPLLRRKHHPDITEDANFEFLKVLNEEMNYIERDALESKLQSSLKTATEDYLNKFGEWFGVYRKEKETDSKYRNRIIRYLLLKRGTNNAIIEGIKYYLDKEEVNVKIYEPYKNIFYTNKSKLNSEDNLMGYYYRFAVINVEIGDYFPQEIVDIINDFKPSGVKLYVTYDGAYTNTGSALLEWLYDLPKVEAYQEYTRLTGFDNLVYGHINMGLRTEGDNLNSKLFTVNDSDINGEDVLSGSTLHGRKFSNLAYKTSYNFKPSLKSLVSSVKEGEGEELNNDYYLMTTDKNKIYYDVPINSNSGVEYIYNNFDIGTYLDKDNPELKLEGAKGISDYFGEVTFDISLKAELPPNENITASLEVYDFKTKSWVLITSKDISFYEETISTEIGYISDYLNDNLILFSRIRFSGYSEETVININYIDMLYYHYTPFVYTLKPFKALIEDYLDIEDSRYVEAFKIFDTKNGDIISKTGFKPYRYIMFTNKKLDSEENPSKEFDASVLYDFSRISPFDDSGNIITSRTYPKSSSVNIDNNVVKRVTFIPSIRTDVSKFRFYTKTNTPTLYLYRSLDKENWEFFKEISPKVTDGTYITEDIENDVVDLYGLSFIDYSDLNPMSTVILKNINNIPINTLINGNTSVNNMPKDYFNAVWTEIDFANEVKDSYFTMIKNTSGNIIDGDSGEIISLNNFKVSPYEEFTNMNYYKPKYDADLVLGSSETLESLRETTLNTETIEVDRTMKVISTDSIVTDGKIIEDAPSNDSKDTKIVEVDKPKTVLAGNYINFKLARPIKPSTRYRVRVEGNFDSSITLVMLYNTNTQMMETIISKSYINISEGYAEKEFTSSSTTSRLNESIMIATNSTNKDGITITNVEIEEV